MVQSILCRMTDEQAHPNKLKYQADAMSWSLLAQKNKPVLPIHFLVSIVFHSLCFFSFFFWTI